MEYVVIYLSLQTILNFFVKLVPILIVQKLRADLRKLYNWSEDWKMLFNVDKCKIMHFGYKNPNNIFLLGGHILETVDEEKDLGVMIDRFEGF